MDHRACRSAAHGFTLAEATDHYPPHLHLAPVHVDLHIDVDVALRRLKVRQTLSVRARSASVRSLALDGVELTNVSASLDGGTSRYDGKQLHLCWDEAFQLGELRVVQIAYEVVDPVTGVSFSSPDDAYPDAPLFAVTDHETERARYWFVSVDHPSARPSLDIHLTARADLTLLANGAPKGEELHEDGTKTAHFAQAEGCPSYLVCFAVGDFVRWDGGEWGGVPIAGFAPRPFEASHLERSFRRTRDMLSFLSERLGVPYPFAKYYQFAAEGIGGAMENISLVSWDDRFLLDEALETEERQLIDVINVHEMAHSWFGDRVVCKDFAHSWLKEGWATYLESCWLEHDQGRDAFETDLWGNAEAYFAEVDERYSRPIVTRKYDSSFDLFDRHLYPGAALRIHMLRQMLGEVAFWGAVKDYLTSHAGGVAETDDFRRALEARSGFSLERFFDQWFHRAGFPDLEVIFRYDGEAREVTFEIIQKQADEKTGAGAFEFELELEFGRGTALHRRTALVSSRRTLVVAALDAAPELIRIDPRARLLHRLDFNPGREQLLRQLCASDARGRIEAGQLLVLHAGRAGVEALRDGFEAEPYWGVRVKWAEALGKAQSEAALEALLQLASTHADPKSLALLLHALGKYRDHRVTRLLGERLDAGLPHRASEAALEALGAQREAAPLSRLLEAAAQPGFGGFSQAAALRALGGTRRPDALEPLITALGPGGAPNRVRHAAAEALGNLAASLSDRERERAIEALENALRDRNPRVYACAAQGLARAKAKGTEPALEALARRLPRQDEVKVLRALASLREAVADPARQREFEQLTDRVRKLSAKLDEVEARLSAKPAS